jgi:PHD-finger
MLVPGYGYTSDISSAPETKDNDNNDDEDEDDLDDHISLASSLSSIPLKDLKRHLQLAAQQQQQQQKQQQQQQQRKSRKIVGTKKDSIAKVSHNSNSNDRKGRPAQKKNDKTVNTKKRSIHKDKPMTMDGTNGHRTHQATTTTTTTTTTTVSSSAVSSHQDDDDPPLATACCLCHCGLDCADRTLFFQPDRIQELQELSKDKDKDKSDKDKSDNDDASSSTVDFTMDDPYVSIQAYDPHNALVYCDGCSRLYHQQCHFVPLFILPRGKWYCLLCTTHTNNNNNNNNNKGNKATAWTPSGTVHPLQDLFQSPPNPSARRQEQEWEHQTGTIQAKQWYQQLAQIRQFCKTQASNIRLASAHLDTFTSIPRNRQHLIILCQNYFRHQQQRQQRRQPKGTAGEDNASQRRFVVSSSSQQLADTLVKLTTSQWKIRTLFMSLERYQQQANHILPDSVLIWAQQQQQQQQQQQPHQPTQVLLPPSSSPTRSNKLMTYLFPHGLQVYQEHRRTIPRTAEWKGHEEVDDVEIKREEGVAMNAPRTAEDAGTYTTSGTKHTTMVPMEISIPDSPQVSSLWTRCLPVSSSPRSTRMVQQTRPATAPSSPPQPTTSTTTTKPAPQQHSSRTMDNNTKNVQHHEDSDSGISLDDLQCCICKLGDATDENDLLLCDGQGCCRAFHMACVWPAITLDDLEGKETENWFCPLCQALPNLLAEIQESCMDEEWVYRKEQSRCKRGKQNSKHKRNKDDDSKNAESTSSSLQSWNGAIDVFPEAEWQMNASKLLKMSPQQQQQQQQHHQQQQPSTDDIARLLGTYLGPDFLPARSHDPTAVSLLLPMGSDSEDENDYSLFDEASFEERKRRRREEKKKRKKTDSDDNDDDDDDDENEEAMSSSPSSTQSSSATLQEMSSVELEIDRNELEALSDGGGDDDDDDHDDASSSSSLSPTAVDNRRISKRLRKKKRWNDSSGHASSGDSRTSRDSRDAEAVANMADFDASNIVQGKRRRTLVDYRKLNDALFGDLTELEQAKLDDQVDYQEHRGGGGKRKKKE